MPENEQKSPISDLAKLVEVIGGIQETTSTLLGFTTTLRERIEIIEDRLEKRQKAIRVESAELVAVAKSSNVSPQQLVFIEYIETLGTHERRELREQLLRCYPNDPLPRNLYFNYETQEWI